jgi:hypothetical protein
VQVHIVTTATTIFRLKITTSIVFIISSVDIALAGLRFPANQILIDVFDKILYVE